MLRNEFEQKKQQQDEMNRFLLELEKIEIDKNTKQMQSALEKEHDNETKQKLDRQKADFLSKFNYYHKHKSTLNFNFFKSKIFFF